MTSWQDRLEQVKRSLTSRQVDWEELEWIFYNVMGEPIPWMYGLSAEKVIEIIEKGPPLTNDKMGFGHIDDDEDIFVF